MARMFGTDGVRGIANDELTVELAMQLGRYGAHVITGGKPGAKIVVARDTRISGEMLEQALMAGILSAGCEAVSVGVVPTPAVAFLVRALEADAGVMISASHNPMPFNGIKFFDKRGLKLPDAVEDAIEKGIREQNLKALPTGGHVGRMTHYPEAASDYMRMVLSTVEGLDLNRLKVAVDCANGAAYDVGPKAFHALGAKVYSLHHEPDGLNINDQCGSTHLETLEGFVRVVGADVGFAFDGDADRLLAIDEHGHRVDGDQIMLICGAHMLKNEALKDKVIVSTVMSNLGFDVAAQAQGIVPIKTQVGDRYVLEEMLKNGYSLGGEQSGHVIFLQHNTTGDGLLTAVQLLKVMMETGKPLSELASQMTVYPQVLKNAHVANGKKHRYLESRAVRERIEAVEAHFKGRGRVLIRPSGTEPLVRVMIEGEQQAELDAVAEELVTLIETESAL